MLLIINDYTPVNKNRSNSKTKIEGLSNADQRNA